MGAIECNEGAFQTQITVYGACVHHLSFTNHVEASTVATFLKRKNAAPADAAKHSAATPPATIGLFVSG